MGSISENRADGLPITIGLKPGGAIPYRSSKSAVNSIMKSLSHDLADQDITVTLLCPGYVATGALRTVIAGPWGAVSLEEVQPHYTMAGTKPAQAAVSQTP